MLGIDLVSLGIGFFLGVGVAGGVFVWLLYKAAQNIGPRF